MLIKKSIVIKWISLFIFGFVSILRAITNKTKKPVQKMYKRLGHKSDISAEVACLENKIKVFLIPDRSFVKNFFVRWLMRKATYEGCLLIGPSNSGKSAFLNRAIGDPYFADPSRPIPKTAVCDLKVQGKEVVFDFSGEFFSESKKENELKALLKLINKYHRQIPIKSLMIVIDVSLFFGDKIGEVSRLKLKIIRHLALFGDCFGTGLSCFFIFDKCGLIPGFDNYNDASQHGCFGMSYLKNDHSFNDVFEKNIKEWVTKIYWHRFRAIHSNSSDVTAYQLYQFPDQFQKILKSIGGFFDEIKQAQKNELFVRGGFFSSIEAKSEDVLYQQIILLTKKIGLIPDGRNKKTYFAAIVLLVMLSYLITSAFIFKKALNRSVMDIGQVESNTCQYVKTFIETTSLSKRKQNLLDYCDTYQQVQLSSRSTSWFLRLGLNRISQLDNNYKRVVAVSLQNLFVPQAKEILEVKLRGYAQKWKMDDSNSHSQYVGDYYLSLKCYLMLAYPNKMNVEEFSDLILYLLQRPNKKIDSNGHRFYSLISIYLEQLKASPHDVLSLRSLTVNKALIYQARKDLKSSSIVPILFHELIAKMSIQHPALSINDFLHKNNSGFYISHEMLPSMYRFAAWQSFVKDEIDRRVSDFSKGNFVLYGGLNQHDDRWAIPAKQEVADIISMVKNEKMKRELYTLYFKGYRNSWMQFISSVTVKPFRSLEDSVSTLSELEKINGPMTDLLQVIAGNINICQRMKPALRSICLREIHEPLNFSNPKKLFFSFKEYFKLLDAFKKEIEAIANNQDHDLAAKNYIVPLMNHDSQSSSLSQVTQSIASVVAPVHPDAMSRIVSDILMSPVRETYRMLIKASLRHVQILWVDQVVTVYRHTLLQKYPFSSSQENAAVVDVDNFFQPREGVLWQVVKEQLSPFLILKDHKWRAKKWFGLNVNFSTEFLNALNQAQKITEILYASQNKSLGVVFQLYPMPTPGISHIAIQINKHAYHYFNGPQRWRKYRWFGGEADGQIILTATTAEGDSMQSLAYFDEWGLFHLFDHAEKKQLGHGLYQLAWQASNAKGRQAKIRFRVKIEGVNDFFEPPSWKNFRLPNRL